MSKFLSYEDRMIIAQRLQENASFGAIGKELGKDRTTISKEIKKYSYDKKSGRPGYPYNPCKFRATCKAKRICGTSCTHQSAYKCSLCSECTLHCSDFVEDVCSVKNKPPYVCNGCSQLPKCTLLKRIYDPADAHERAHHAVSEARTGIMSNEDDIARINGIISPLVKSGQSLHQIYLAHVDELMCSEKTLYNYVDGCLFDIRNIDLPRKVKYRPRYKKPELKVDRGCRVGRNYHDYEVYMEQHPDTAVVQMDSVIGSKGGKVLLTIYFVNVSLMLGFLREANTSKSVIDIYDELESTNQTAKKEAMMGEAGHGAFVIARSQTAGRGRRGREFYSPADTGLYMSVILKPQGTIHDSLLITTAAAVAVYRAVAQLCGIQLDIKWVNDLFYKGKKVCGILTEAVTDFESGNIEFVVVGMGLNLYLDQENMPAELRNIAGALYETKEDAEQTDRNKLTAMIVNELRKETADLKLSPDYVTHNMIPGHQITITDGNSSRQAFALEICRDGRLKVREENGQETILSFGEVSVSM